MCDISKILKDRGIVEEFFGDGSRNMRWADLSGADLRWAVLEGANLEGAVLEGADLRWAVLRGAVLEGADLTGTCLDPAAPANEVWPGERDAEGHAIGYRSKRLGAVVGNHRDLSVGETVEAPVFSVADTECHPGLYMWPTLKQAEAWAKDWRACGEAIVKVRVDGKLHHAGNKYRYSKLTVLEEMPHA